MTQYNKLNGKNRNMRGFISPLTNSKALAVRHWQYYIPWEVLGYNMYCHCLELLIYLKPNLGKCLSTNGACVQSLRVSIAYVHSTNACLNFCKQADSKPQNLINKYLILSNVQIYSLLSIVRGDYICST